MVTMRWLLVVTLLLAVVVQDIVCPPVQKQAKKEEKKDPEMKPEEDVNFGLEYERYLKEVVSILETDEVFKKKLEDSNISDIKSGEIARHLELVSHNVRTKLDELKRQELDRLRQIQRLNMRRQNGLPPRDLTEINRLVAHLDHNNPHTFEVEDLSKLIKQATDDLEVLDKKRKDEFKKYEMEKEHLHKKKMEVLDEVHRAEEERAWEENREKHKKHPKLHHPGSKDQLEEVWEESDGLNKDDFDPRTFFMLHDTNGDGMLDPVEVEALFQKELDKIYDPNAPEDDMMERYEEMNRMREHVMNEVDKNKDSLITLDEFLDSTKADDFEKDPGWKTLDDQELFTEEELAQFEKDYEARRQYEAQPGEINLGGGQGFEHHEQPPVHHEQPPVQHHQGDPNVVQHHQQAPPVPVLHQEQVPQHQQQPPLAQQQHIPAPVLQHQPPAPEHQQQQQQHQEQQQLKLQEEPKLVQALHPDQKQPVGQEQQQPVVNMDQQHQQQQQHEPQPPAQAVGGEAQPQQHQPPAQ